LPTRAGTKVRINVVALASLSISRLVMMSSKPRLGAQAEAAVLRIQGKEKEDEDTTNIESLTLRFSSVEELDIDDLMSS
jgi:hypothetical protein